MLHMCIINIYMIRVDVGVSIIKYSSGYCQDNLGWPAVVWVIHWSYSFVRYHIDYRQVSLIWVLKGVLNNEETNIPIRRGAGLKFETKDYIRFGEVKFIG